MTDTKETHEIRTRRLGEKGNVVAFSLGFDVRAPKEGPPTDFLGWRERGVAHVGTRDHLLNPRFDILRISPGSIDWRNESGVQLSLAILAYHTRADDFALRYYRAFWGAVVTALPRESWRLEAREIDAFCRYCVVTQGEESESA